MADFSKITVVSVTGLQKAAGGAGLAVAHSARELPGSRALLLSPARPENLPAGVAHCAIEPFGYLEYSLFMLYALADFIETEYALVVQEDGWVLSGRNWRPEFLDYDYIGAPVHLARARTRRGKIMFMTGFDWCKELGRTDLHIELVMNGGFSLRSKRLLKAPREHGLRFCIPPISGLQGEPRRMHWQNQEVYEDVWLCTAAREVLESKGLKFAPLQLATSFSIEHATPDLHRGFPMSSIFGHHANIRKIKNIDPGNLALDYTLSQEGIDNTYGYSETLIVNLLMEHGWRIDWPDGSSSASPDTAQSPQGR